MLFDSKYVLFKKIILKGKKKKKSVNVVIEQSYLVGLDFLPTRNALLCDGAGQPRRPEQRQDKEVARESLAGSVGRTLGAAGTADGL